MDTKVEEGKIEGDFKLILKKADDEDYEQCSAFALQFLKDHGKNLEAQPYLPYARYFKLFSEAYRKWQISYEYTPIRSRFGLAYHALERGLNEKKNNEDKILLSCFEQLSKMLCAYTRCENSVINNDPFTLEKNADDAIKYEETGLDILKKSKLLKNAKLYKKFTEQKRKQQNITVSKVIQESTPIEHCQFEMALWLEEYLNTNKLLHEGLKGCAECYSILLQKQRAMRAVEKKKFDDIEKNQLKKLREKSPELFSELNAHICHINNHNNRLTKKKEENKKSNISEKTNDQNEQEDTFLRINKGFLVVQMSAAFDADLSSDLFLKTEKQDEFSKNIKNGFDDLGIEVSSYKMNQLHDVFQTSFGESSLKTMSFDLWKNNSDGKEIGVEILNECYDFDLRFSVSALGVCTLYFKLNIDNLNIKPTNKKTLRNKVGMRVEEARVLQSLLCPHAGQVKITDALSIKDNSDDFKLNYFRFIDRIELADVVDNMERLRNCLAKNQESYFNADESLYNKLNKALNGLDATLKKVETNWLGQAKNKENLMLNGKVSNSSCKELKKAVNYFDTVIEEAGNFVQIEIIKAEGESNQHSEFEVHLKKFIETGQSDLQNSNFDYKIAKISEKLDDHNRAAHLAEQYFNVIGNALAETLPGIKESLKSDQENVLKPAIDTGWFTYLYCRSIDEVKRVGNKIEVVRPSAGFDEIINHPDLMGFVVEPREARASFDDWRFIKQIKLKNSNLAYIRSHQTDGFFCSEYQAFIYFPDDPMFLTDQYEATVKLMVRLATVLRYISEKARNLAEGIHQNLLHQSGETQNSEELDKELGEIRRLRLHAKKLQTLVAHAAISRYKDHGDLMKRILSEMKLDQMAKLLDQQLEHLSDLYSVVLRKVEEKERDKAEKHELKVSRFIEFLTVVVGFSALSDLAGALVGIARVKTYFISILGLQVSPSEEIFDKIEGYLTLIIMGIAIFLFTVFFSIRWKFWQRIWKPRK